MLYSELYSGFLAIIFGILFIALTFDAVQWKRNRGNRVRLEIVWITFAYAFYVQTLIIDYVSQYDEEGEGDGKEGGRGKICTFVVTFSEFVYLIYYILTVRVFIAEKLVHHPLLRACLYLSPFLALLTTTERPLVIPTCTDASDTCGFVCGVQIPIHPFVIIFGSILSVSVSHRSSQDDPRFIVMIIFYIYIAAVGIFGTFRDHQEYTLKRYVIQNIFTASLSMVTYLLARDTLANRVARDGGGGGGGVVEMQEGMRVGDEEDVGEEDRPIL